MSVDPLAEEYSGWSPYNYTMDNPVKFIDPDGMSVASPIFDEEGNFLGTDSEGFTGDIIIMDRNAYNTVSNNGAETLDHDQVMTWAESSPLVQTLDDFVANDFDYKNSDDREVLKSVFTNLLSAANDEGLISYDVSNLAFGKIGVDNDTENPNGNAATMYDAGGGKDAISVLMKPGKDGGNFSMLYDIGNAANAIHILGVHEPLHRKHRSRGIKGHHAMYKEIYSNPEYRKSLENVTPAVRELAEKWHKGR